jgi:hypothetical protein
MIEFIYGYYIIILEFNLTLQLVEFHTSKVIISICMCFILNFGVDYICIYRYLTLVASDYIYIFLTYIYVNQGCDECLYVYKCKFLCDNAMFIESNVLNWDILSKVENFVSCLYWYKCAIVQFVWISSMRMQEILCSGFDR